MPPITNNQPRPKKKTKKWEYILLIILVVVMGGTFWIAENGEKVRDFYTLLTYKPPQTIVALAIQDTMTSYGKELFYVNKPQLLSKQAFSNQCPNILDEDYVIGCYHVNDNGIFLLNVKDANLSGIVPVTAAYEMLHAGYARIPLSQRNLLDGQMWSFYEHDVQSSAIKQQMKSYLATEPGEQYDELFSVLGTEVQYLPNNISSIYKQYFYDRSKIVDLYNHYQAAFTTRQQQINTDRANLEQLKSSINSSEVELNQILAKIKIAKTQINNAQQSPKLTSINTQIDNYNSLVSSYNNLLINIKNNIAKYNSIVNNLNSIVLQEQQLIKAINSNNITTKINK